MPIAGSALRCYGGGLAAGDRLFTGAVRIG